ncbi:Microsomal glutathione S-transferase 3, partial [Bienertia sinuspersici]
MWIGKFQNLTFKRLASFLTLHFITLTYIKESNNPSTFIIPFFHSAIFSTFAIYRIGDKMEVLLAKEYGYVVLVLVFYCFFNFWMGFQVGKARKRYKVNYPILYASESENKDAKLFNCVQNSLEMMPVFFMLMILGGMRHPCICAGLGAFYIISRYFYFTGYSSGDPQKRLSI